MSNSIYPAGSKLLINQAWCNSTGRTILRLQEDRNLVLYKDGNPVWQAANAWGHGDVAKVQDDGNFVLYDEGGNPIWASNTSGNPGAYLAIQDDGNLVVYTKDGTPLWATNTGD